MTPLLIAIAISSSVAGEPAGVAFNGPGRFCGYSAVIDLLPGEQIEPLGGGIHGGTFRWTGKFGSLVVSNTGWASRPRDTITYGVTATGQTLLRPRGNKFAIGIWNRQHGIAHFSTDGPLTLEKRTAIDRVYLVNEGDEPGACTFRTTFDWE